jgi:IS1 family transposase
MNRLATDKRIQVVAALVEGTSINATCRMTGVAKHTVLKLLKDMGCACAAYHDAHVRNVKSKRIQCDEIWSFVYAKKKNITQEQWAAGAGDCRTWTAIDADTKLIVTYVLGERDGNTARIFIEDLAARLSNRIQLTTDGLRLYAEIVEETFGSNHA